MTSKLTDARRSLVRAKQAAQERLQQIDAERREMRASIKSLDAALKALDKSKGQRRNTSTASQSRPDDEAADPSHSDDTPSSPDSQ